MGTRRSFLGSGLLLVRPDQVRGAGKEKLKIGVVGCGGRGTQAVVDCLTINENVELTAMGDVFEDKLEQSLRKLRDPKYIALHKGKTVERAGQTMSFTAEQLVSSIQPRIKVDPEHHFTGLNAYQKVLASDIDIVLLTTPPGYRPIHFEAAVAAGKHVFAEKPVATDPVGARRFMAAARVAEQKKLTVCVGANLHYDRARIETYQKIRDGAIGEVLACYTDYMTRPVLRLQTRDSKLTDMEWQHRNWYSFTWICGDAIVEQNFHMIDSICWLMGANPVSVVSTGGICWRKGNDEVYGNIYDHIASSFRFANGVRYDSLHRQYPIGSYNVFSTSIVGSKGKSTGTDLGTRGLDGHVQEHEAMVKSILGAGPYVNTGVASAETTLASIMARESAYSGLEITWDQIMASKLDLMPKAFDLSLKTAPPVLPAPGTYKLI